jgi:hypothetical protein
MAGHPRRSSIGMPVAFSMLLLADCALALTPAVHDAREEARRSACTNNLFQHSGAHGWDTVILDRDGNITAVSSCPLCAVPEGFPLLDAEFYREGREPERIPPVLIPESIRQATRARLNEYKRADWYRWLRDSFSPHSASQPIAAAPTSPGG